MRALTLSLLPTLVFGFACSGDGTDPVDLGPVTDLGTNPADAGPRDNGPTLDMGADAGTPETGPIDMGGPNDAGPTDVPMGQMQAMVPGTSVTVAQGTVQISVDTFDTVTALLGAGVRQAGTGNRSYQWTLAGGGELTVWFGNSNLDADDDPPNDVDGTDRVLWAAVTNGFVGVTPMGPGLGSSRTEVETAYGAADHEVDLTTTPPGRLAQYFRTGMLVTYDMQDNVRTLTISRAYNLAPDGALDPDGRRIRFGAGDIRGLRSIAQQGTRESDVRSLLGEPDAEGTVRLGGQNLDTLSYGFFGVEVFFLSGSSSTLFVAVHAPYYGTLPGGATVGATRTAIEAELTNLGYTGRPSSMAALVCYGNGNDEVGVTYSTDNPPVATSISIPLLSCP